VRVLITGGAGMVGSHVAELLEARGDEVTIIDNFATGRPEHLLNLKTQYKFEDSIANESLYDQLSAQFSNIDVIVHTAASFANGNDWSDHINTNVLGTALITRLAQKFNCRLVYFQTALCYGDNPTMQPVPLKYPRQPMASSYAISKTAGEFYIEQSGVDFVTFRLANIVGPRNLSGPLPIFYKRISAGKKCVIANAKRDFIDVRNLATVVLQAIDGRGNGAYHFSSGKDVQIIDLYKKVVSAMGLDFEPEYDFQENAAGGPPSILLDPTRTYSDFDMPILNSIEETVSGAISYYEKFGVTREVTHLKKN
jgi:nucleoside-diphosphate-sugar epimerase